MLEQCKEIMTVAEVAKVLYVGKNRIYELLENGSLKGFRIGRVWKIPRQAVSDYISSQSGIGKGNS